MLSIEITVYSAACPTLVIIDFIPFPIFESVDSDAQSKGDVAHGELKAHTHNLATVAFGRARNVCG